MVLLQLGTVKQYQVLYLLVLVLVLAVSVTYSRKYQLALMWSENLVHKQGHHPAGKLLRCLLQRVYAQ